MTNLVAWVAVLTPVELPPPPRLLSQAALQSTQKGLAEKSADIAALRAAHETEMADAAEEAEHMRDAMADKHAAATEALVAAHGEAMRAAEERYARLFPIVKNTASGCPHHDAALDVR